MIKIRTFLVIALLIALVPLLLLNVFTYRRDLDERRRTILNRNLEVAQTVAVGFRSFILRSVQTQEAAGLAIIEGDFDQELRATYLSGVRARNGQLNSLSYASPDGEILASDPGDAPPIPEQNLRAIDGGAQWAVSDLEPVGRFRARFHVTAAVRVENRVVALVDSTITDDTVFDFIRIRIGRRGNIGIIDRDGRAVALSFQRNLTWQQRDRTFIPSIRPALRGRPATTGEFEDPLGGLERMGSSVPIEPIGWVANVFQPVDEVFDPVREQALAQALTSFLISAAALALVLILGGSITGPIQELVKETRPFRRGRFDHRLPANYRVAEVNELAEALNRTAAETQRRFEAERHIASTLQAALLPVEAPELPGYDIGTRYASATKQALVGGDFYDFIPLSEQESGLVIGDIQGKGIDAAASTATIKFALRDLAARRRSAAAVLRSLNAIAMRELRPEEFITLAFLALNLQTGVIEYANAGHHPPLICGAPTGRVLDQHGGALGLMAEAEYEIGRDLLEAGEILVLYTDGVVETRAGKELFGLDRVQAIVCREADSSAQLIAEMIYQACVEFGGGELNDDLAVVIVKRLKQN
jgi:serine phosphatase RsbU (regulator of sigma subunit)